MATASHTANPLAHDDEQDTFHAVNAALALLQSMTAHCHSLHDDKHTTAGFTDTLDDIRDALDGLTGNEVAARVLAQVALAQTAMMGNATAGDASALLGLHQRIEKARRLIEASNETVSLWAA